MHKTKTQDHPRRGQLEYLEHPIYVIERTLGVYTELINTHGESPKKRNDFIELGLLQVRQLVDFFEGTTKRKDDMLANDYSFPTSKISLTNGQRERINKELMHLTYARKNAEEQGREWPLRDILDEVLKRSEEFILHLQTHYGERLPANVASHCEPLRLCISNRNSFNIDGVILDQSNTCTSSTLTTYTHFFRGLETTDHQGP